MKMGVDFEKCEKCGECLNTQCFPSCFCCENYIDDLCDYCIPDHNCVDKEEIGYMCDKCIQHETDDEIKSSAKNYAIKNVTKIIRQV